MLNFLYLNPIFIVVFVFFAFLFIAYLLLKNAKIKSNSAKVQKIVEPKAPEPVSEEPAAAEPEVLVPKPETEEVVYEEKGKKSNRKRITKIFKSDSQTEYVTEPQEQNVNTNVEFEQLDSKLSKFKSYSAQQEVLEDDIEKNTDEYGFVTDEADDCEFCQDNVKHFDHSRRLSKSIKDNDFDNMFAGHISDHYMNINSNKHLRALDDIQEKLYKRASETLGNSGAKVLTEEDKNRIQSSDESWIEEKRREEFARMLVESSQTNEEVYSPRMIPKDAINLSAKNILVIDAILHRKKSNNK